MPIVNNKYISPIWINGSEPALNAQNLQDLSDTVQTLDAVPPTPIYSENINSGWVSIYSKISAVSDIWIAPDYFGGKPYYVGVEVIGAGGGGGSAIYTGNYSKTIYASGGGSGLADYAIIKVKPGLKFNITISTGGASFTATYNDESKFGADGGSTTFTGSDYFGSSITMVGYGGSGGIGSGGRGNSGGSPTNGAPGGQGSTYSTESSIKKFIHTAHAGVKYDSSGYYGGVTYPSMCFSPFRGKFILSAGGSATAGSGGAFAQEFSPLLGYTTSHGAAYYGDATSSISASRGNAFGCGGGAATLCTSGSSTSITATGAYGKDGSVHVFVMGSGRYA